MPFRILIVGTEEYLRDPANPSAFLEFETGQEANAACKLRSEASTNGSKFRVKRVLDTRWRSRETEKFDNGFYQPLPWSGSSWWRSDAAFEIHKLHYAHPSHKEPGMLAYTASPEQGMDNRKTRVKPGRYLEQFAKILVAHGVSAQALANDFRHKFEPKTLLIADTMDMAEWVYENGPSSCMSGYDYRVKHGWGWQTPGKWPHNTHAARMYIGHDLQIAYLTENDKPKGHVVARSVIWPAKKTHSRCYGDEIRMKSALIANGYKFNPPIGAKLQREKIKGTRLFIVPYLDAGTQAGQGALAVVDKTTHLEIVRTAPKTYPANTTSGACGAFLDSNGRPQLDVPDHCTSCGDNTDECGELSIVHISAAGGDLRHWCQSCMQGETYYCEQSGRYYSREHMPSVEMYNGQLWSDHAFRRHGFVCGGNHRRYPANQLVVVDDGNMNWSQDYFADHGFRCDYSGDAYSNSARINLADGHAMAARVFARHGFTCRDCHRNLLLSERHGRSTPTEQPQCIRCHTDAVTANMANDPANRQPRIERTEEHNHE